MNRTLGRLPAGSAPPAAHHSRGARIWLIRCPASGIWSASSGRTASGAGATAPGVPGIVMGRSPHIAWAFTTTFADTQDVVETPAGEGMYATPDGPRPFVTREERIRVRGRPDVLLQVRETRHGPVISDISPEEGGKRLAVAMTSLIPGDTTASGCS